MSADNEYIFELRADEFYFENNIEPEVNSDEFFEIKEIECGIEQISIQNKTYKNLDDILQTVECEITAMCLEHEKENKIYDLLKMISVELKTSCHDQLDQFLSTNPMNQSVKKIVSNIHEYVYEKIDLNSTRHKRQNQLKTVSKYIQPTEMALGFKWILKKSNCDLPDYKLVQESFQYVSILDTLSSLFSDEEFRIMYNDYNTNKHECVDGGYVDFCCGKRFKELDVFVPPLSVQIQLGIDDFEVCCPIKSKVKIHKMTGIYFQIRNIPQQYRSRLNNIHLIALCKTQNTDSETDHIDHIANVIVNELKILETDGIMYNDKLKVNGSLIHILADNLGANTISGFVKCFNAQYPCRFCTSSIDDRRSLTIECQEKKEH